MVDDRRIDREPGREAVDESDQRRAMGFTGGPVAEQGKWGVRRGGGNTR
jgi:hypothetical protein